MNDTTVNDTTGPTIGISATTIGLIELAHRRALETAELRRELALAHGRLAALAHDAGARRDLEAQLAATTAALDRLRALPELRVGQRLRHTARRLRPRGSGPPEGPPATVAPGDATATAAPGSTSEVGERPTGLGYPDQPPPSAIIVVRDRRRGLGPLLAWLDEHGVERVEIVDDGSTDPATVELLGTLDRPVHRVQAGLGPGAPWALGLVAELSLDEPVLVIDGDTVPAASCPADAPERLRHELQRAPDVDAVALGSARDGRRGPSTERPASGREEDTPDFALVRARLPHLPRRVATLAEPYVARRASWAAGDDDPAERYARLAREVQVG